MSGSAPANARRGGGPPAGRGARDPAPPSALAGSGPVPAPAGAAAVPARYRVAWRRAETADTVTLGLRPVDRAVPAHRPGQFSMLYAFGAGEVPISISGTAGGPDLVHTIRSVGAVTRKLCTAEPGQLVGVRGPFGTDWDVDGAAGHDLLMVAGGIGLAPLRPALVTALAARARFRRITLLIGARSPAELVFAGELPGWRERGAGVGVTVDHATAGWKGRVGVVTQFLDRADIDPPATVAMVCGPEVMMRLTARALCERGVGPGRIRVSLERNMRCGTAECGHCQLGPLLLCRDGPVVSYQRAAPLLGIAEL
jgi:anaerobic sulfite reductase subunit B